MKQSLFRTILFACFALLVSSAAHAQWRDIYISPDGPGSLESHGTNWATAYSDLTHTLITYARSNAYIYVKGGTWFLTNQLPFRATNVFIKGGYEGVGEPGSNNPLYWPTVFTLGHEQEGTITNRIMVISSTNCSLENITLCNGLATLSASYHPITPLARGGGIYMAGCRGVTLRGCNIISNTADDIGGGIYIDNYTYNTTITGCVIGANSLFNPTAAYGSGIYQHGGELILANTLVHDNKSYAMGPQGLGLYQYRGNAFLNHCTFAKHYNEGIRCAYITNIMIISNSILWDFGQVLAGVPDTDVYYSIVRNGENTYMNEGCFYDDPLFVDPDNNDFHLQSMQGHWMEDLNWVEDYANSPAIDAASPLAPFNNENMPNGGRANLGAYGNTEQASRTLTAPILLASSRLIVTNHAMTNYALLGQSATNQPFYIWNSNGYGRNLFFTNVTDVSWLRVSPETGSHAVTNAPFVLQALYDTSALPLGTHTGRIIVAASDSRGNVCSNSPSSLKVVTHVVTGPSMSIHPKELHRTVVYGTNAPSQNFEVWNPDLSRFGLAYAVEASDAWVSVSPDSGTSYGEHNTLSVNYDVAGLGPGPHTATITVYGAVSEYPLVAVSNSPQQIKVNLTVTRKPGLSVLPTALLHSVTVGHPAPLTTLDIWNSSLPPLSAMNYGIWSDRAWITPDPSAGNSMGEHDTVNLWFSTTNMVSGIYTANVTVAAGHWAGGSFVHTPADNSPIVIPTILRINSMPEINAHPHGFTNYITLGGDALPQRFRLWNGADAPKGPVAYYITNDSPWVFAEPEAGSIGGDEFTDITVRYRTTALPKGTYHGVLTVRAYDPTTSENLNRVNIDVSLMIRPMPILSATPSSYQKIILENSADSSDSLSLWNSSGLPQAMMNYIITCDKPWITITPASGFSAGETRTSQIAFNASGLEDGFHYATITVVAWDESTGQIVQGSPRNIPITLQVLPRKPANVEPPTLAGLPYIGQRLTVYPGLWTPPGSVALTTQWQRADNALGLSLHDIPGATYTNYVLRREDAGKYIRAKVIAVENSAWPPITNVAGSVFIDAYKVRAAKFDFDADGKADPWFYNPSTGNWHIRFSSGIGSSILPFGWHETVCLPGDYDGDGLTDLAVYYQAGGLWYILTSGGEFRIENFGWYDTGPVPGDYDGDGLMDIAVYYPPTGTWYILLTASRRFIAVDFGFTGALPVPGDYDGDRITDLAVYHQEAGNWYAMTVAGRLLAWAYNFGWFGAMPVPGDYTGDGAMNLAVYEQAANTWYFLIDNQLRIGTFGTATGNAVPFVADYDGDGICDVATVHINGTHLIWCIFQSSKGYTGASYDAAAGRWR